MYYRYNFEGKAPIWMGNCSGGWGRSGRGIVKALQSKDDINIYGVRAARSSV
jgi:hypothetical protein